MRHDGLAAILLAGLGSVHCATAEDNIQGVPDTSTATGGTGNTGWATGGNAPVPGTGGAGAAASGGVPAGNDCPNASQKRCSGICVSPSPTQGCSMTTCGACPSTNGTATCSGSQCDITCNAGYVKSGTSCLSATGTGGTGTGGAGGTTDACADGVKNGGESDVDCGGAVCTPCTTGRACIGVDDCASGVCEQNCVWIFCEPYLCIAPACDDGVANGTEGDVDCGGSCTARCADGRACNANADCEGASCSGGVCGQPPACGGEAGPCDAPDGSTGDSGSSTGGSASTCEAGPDVCAG